MASQARRENVTYEATFGNAKAFFTVDENAQGAPIGLWLVLHPADAEEDVIVWANQWAILASKLLQAGYDLEALVDSMLFTRFEPAGVVRSEYGAIKIVTSPLDWAGRILAINYLGRADLDHSAPHDPPNGEPLG